MFNGEKILMQKNKVDGLIGYWNFEETRVVDNSGLRNHALNLVRAGPSFDGQGSSALFVNGDYLEVPHTKAFESKDFSITFWMLYVQDYFTENNGIRFCPLLQKGKDDLESKTFERFPSIYLDRKNKNLKINVKINQQKKNNNSTNSNNSTNNDNENNEDEEDEEEEEENNNNSNSTEIKNKENLEEGKSLISNSKIQKQKWLHISLIKKHKKLKLFINGILDSELKISQEILNNKDSLYIGGTPWLKKDCQFPFIIDELRYYNKGISESLIKSEAAPALGGIEPDFIQLGCINCSLKKAKKSCKRNYQICSTIELHTAGYQIARSLGWIDWSTHIWTKSALKALESFKGFLGLGMCCKKMDQNDNEDDE